MLARIIAVIAHEIVTEYRKLSPPPAPQPPAPEPAVDETLRYDPRSTTGAQVERAAGWDHDKTPPVTAAGFGFRV